jgi:hypothetical protein
VTNICKMGGETQDSRGIAILDDTAANASVTQFEAVAPP